MLRRDHPLALAPGLYDVTKRGQKRSEGEGKGARREGLHTPSVDCREATDDKAK